MQRLQEKTQYSGHFGSAHYAGKSSVFLLSARKTGIKRSRPPPFATIAATITIDITATPIASLKRLVTPARGSKRSPQGKRSALSKGE